MADVDSHLFMKFVLGGKPIEGEAGSHMTLTKSVLTAGFEPGRMFEVESFHFSAGVPGTDKDTTDDQEKNRRDRIAAADEHKAAMEEWEASDQTRPEPKLRDVPQLSSIGAFEKWRNGQSAVYPVDIAPVEFSRPIDRASAILLQNCIKRVTYDSATLIKRKPAGGPAAGEVYLRLDFTGVLMTRVDWNEDNPVQEKCRFICRAVTVSYRPQLADGRLGAVVPGFWSMSPGLRQVRL